MHHVPDLLHACGTQVKMQVSEIIRNSTQDSDHKNEISVQTGNLNMFTVTLRCML